MKLQLTSIPTTKAGMLIRKPADEVYETTVNPDITTKFWFTKSSGRFVEGKFIRWDWEMCSVSTMVDVKQREPGKWSLLDSDVDKNPKRVGRIFMVPNPGTTSISVTGSGFSGEGDKIVEQAMG